MPFIDPRYLPSVGGGSDPLPSASGTLQVGNTLTPNLIGAQYKYEWKSGGNVSSTSANYGLSSGDAGSQISLQILKDLGTVVVGVVPIPVPEYISLPGLTGLPYPGQTLTVSVGSWRYSPSAYTTTLYKNGSSIGSGTTYVVQESDLGATFFVKVVATNSSGQSSAIDSPSLTIVSAPVATALSPNPVTTRLTGLRTFDIGPGQAYTETSAFPWNDLQAGDVVNIHYRSTPYTSKIGIRGSGTFSNKIIVHGVTDAYGNRPILDGNGATTPDLLTQGSIPVFRKSGPGLTGSGPLGSEGSAVVIIRRSPVEPDANYRPSHITIQNLQIQGAASGNTYIDSDGVTRNYAFCAGVYGRTADFVTVQNCVLTNNIMGIFTFVNSSGVGGRCEDWTVRSNRIVNWGAVGSNTEHGLYLQGVRFTTECNYVAQGIAGAGGSGIKNRVGGDTIRYNWIVANTGRALDMVEMEEQELDNPDPTYAVNLPEYGIDWVYGNVIINDWTLPNGSSYRPIHYGGDNIGEQTDGGPAGLPTKQHRKKLHFFNNTVFSNVSNGAARQFIFQISLRDIVVELWNNVFILLGTTPLHWTQHAGTMNFRGTNVVYRSGGDLTNAQYDANPANVILNYLGTIITTNPLVQSTSSGSLDLSLTDASPALDVGVAVPSGLSASIAVDHPVQFQPRLQSNGSFVRTVVGSAMDLGAFEYDPSAPPTVAPANLTLPSVSPSVAVINTELTGDVGTWLRMSGGTYSVQWQLFSGGSWVDVAGQTSSTFTPTLAGDYRYRVDATNVAGTTREYSQTVVISAGAIVAPSLGNVSADQAYSRNVAGTSLDTQSLTNILLFITDSDTSYTFDPVGVVYDNKGNSGWTHIGTVDIPNGSIARRVHIVGKTGAAGGTGHSFSIYPGPYSYSTVAAVEVTGTVTFGTPVVTTDSATPYESSNVTLASDARMIACAATKFTAGGSFVWGGGFTGAISVGTLGGEERMNLSIASRVGAAGTYKASTTLVSASINGDVAMIVIPVSGS